MLNFTEPKFSRSQVKKAGKAIRDGISNSEDVLILENWRASHAYILNTFQANLRNRSKGKEITVAQRLKRRHTIFDKLRREPNMQLSTMHDIAGCRLIFQDYIALKEYRTSLHNSRFKHTLVHETEPDKYNYIVNPKDSGYRGIHDVYEYCVTSRLGPKWNGLRIEIQYRTKPQHAWATAVEVADLITINRIKFSEADQKYRRFFQLASEIISRSSENEHSCLSSIGNFELINEFREIDNILNLMKTFENIQSSRAHQFLKTNTILIFHADRTRQLEIQTFDNVNKALSKLLELEKELEGEADVVLVRAEDEANVRDAFRNYFTDTNDFVRYISDGLEMLRTNP